MTTVRRSAATLVATALLCTGAVGAVAPAATAAPSPKPTTPTLPAGLYGTKDPTYDGVWRQSLAFLAQQTAGVKPAQVSVDWLLGQQCGSGAFASYRPDPAKTCDPATMLDVNATAVAVQALNGIERNPATATAATTASAGPSPAVHPVSAAVAAGAGWLKGAQNKDGGWGYNPGSPSDANSTALVVSTLAALGQQPGAVKSAAGKSPYDALITFAKPCADKDGPGAFAYQPDKTGKLFANGDATAAATLAGLGKPMNTRGVKPDQKPTCEDMDERTAERVARNGASYLATALAKTGHLVQPPMPGATDPTPKPDFGNTADAVVALAAAGHGPQAMPALSWLEKNSPAWAKENGPAAYAQLVFAAHAMGANLRDFGGTDLVEQLNATGPAPQAPTGSPDTAEDEDFNVWWIVGIGLLAGVGVGFLLSGRRKGKQQ
ncbi:prenyltransferase/squalene oxidase repeat-containing protein [Streptomyces purpureus]|uniref:Secreted protein n=1 Tax=Streptomyces purpureus TaxID=1951 RepID=A0A918LND9_9ACTN|nr:prenyltransferase/squalene oxidase repeat-containing protein [Streptomyces purpureus]GGT26836.1 hypothetical protein GCM10014713_20160 [Streptomyces purpureus]